MHNESNVYMYIHIYNKEHFSEHVSEPYIHKYTRVYIHTDRVKS